MLTSYLQYLSSKFDNALNQCSLNQYLNVGSAYFDLNIQEKALDNIIDLLQKNQLDLNTNLDALEKACNYLNVCFFGLFFSLIT